MVSTEKPKVKKQILSDMPRILFQILLSGARELIIQTKLVQNISLTVAILVI